MNVENVHSSGHSPVSQVATHFMHSVQQCLSSCFKQFCWDLIRTCGFATWCLAYGSSKALNEVVYRLLLPIFMFNSFCFFSMLQVFAICFPSVCDLCSFSQIFASRWLDTLHTWLELSSHWFDYLEQLPGIFPGLSYGVVSLRDPMFSRFIPRIIYLVDFHHCFFDLYQIWWTYRLIISD